MPQSCRALTGLLGAWLGMFAVVVVLLVIVGGRAQVEDVNVLVGSSGRQESLGWQICVPIVSLQLLTFALYVPGGGGLRQAELVYRLLHFLVCLCVQVSTILRLFLVSNASLDESWSGCPIF